MTLTSEELKNVLESSYQKNNLAQRTVGKRFTLDTPLSNREHKVYLDNQTHKPIFVSRGTSNLNDVGTDFMLATPGLRYLSSRFANDKKALNDVHNKYGNSAIVLGHSMGGSVVSTIGSHNDKIITLNRGFGLGEVFNKKRPNEIILRTSLDPVSVIGLTNFGKQKTISNYNPLQSHDISNLKNNKFVI